MFVVATSLLALYLVAEVVPGCSTATVDRRFTFVSCYIVVEYRYSGHAFDTAFISGVRKLTDALYQGFSRSLMYKINLFLTVFTCCGRGEREQRTNENGKNCEKFHLGFWFYSCHKLI